MNRHERRKARKRSSMIDAAGIHSKFDIGVDAKAGDIVMIYANAAGRRVVEDLWPEVEWSTDEKFSRSSPADWLFTHIRVTKLPPYLESQVPLKFANTESLAFAVAMELQRLAKPGRVFHFSGEAPDVRANVYQPTDRPHRDMFVEYMAPGPLLA
jgi:hypothetical protein